MGWANAITLGRAVLTVVLWVLLVATGPFPAPWAWWTGFWMFVVAAATDALDGTVARTLGETSAFGRMADPLVDKLLILGTMVALLGLPTLHDVMPAWAVVVILAREMVVTAVRGSVESRGVAFGAALSGKVKMVAQCAAVGAALAHGGGLALARAGLPGLGGLPGGAERWNVAHGLVLLAVALTVVSGIDYVLRAGRILRRAP